MAAINQTAESFSRPYRITLERESDRTIGDTVTCILIIGGRPRPLADGGSIMLTDDRKVFEIPVMITKNSRKKFEGVITGIADGADIRIVWGVDLNQKTLSTIKQTTNSTVTFQAKPGATRW